MTSNIKFPTKNQEPIRIVRFANSLKDILESSAAVLPFYSKELTYFVPKFS